MDGEEKPERRGGGSPFTKRIFESFEKQPLMPFRRGFFGIEGRKKSGKEKTRSGCLTWKTGCSRGG